jgi:SOS response regulatory protein OraA/RecX
MIVETITYDEYPSAYQSAKKQLIEIKKKVDKELIKKGLPSSYRQRLIRNRFVQYLTRQGYQQELIHRVWTAILQEETFP